MNLKKISILVNYNLYESKRYFTKKFAEALARQGIEASIIDSDHKLREHSSMLIDPRSVDITCSFNSIIPSENGQFVWDITKIPHWSIFLDPAFYYPQYLSSPYSIISCVDHMDCQFIQDQEFDKVFFWPHAVERELQAEGNERPYDVVFLGSCYDHENLRDFWQKHLPENFSKSIEAAIEIYTEDQTISLPAACRKGLLQHNMVINEEDFKQMVFAVDNYVRGKDRTELIRSIKDAHVHVFGGVCWRSAPPVKGWGHTLASMPNVTIHPSLPFAESLEILKKSKICLNSMPFFKNGTHERIFTGLACGAVPITTDNRWVRENFVDGEELLIYKPLQWNQVNEQVNDLLAHEDKRFAIAARGREIVMKHHTWDHRVQEMLTALKPILNTF